MKQILEKVLLFNSKLDTSKFHQNFGVKGSLMIVLCQAQLAYSDIKGENDLVSISFSVNKDSVWLRNVGTNLSKFKSSNSEEEGMNQELNIAEALTQFLERLLSLKIEGNFDQVNNR